MTKRIAASLLTALVALIGVAGIAAPADAAPRHVRIDTSWD
jgi:hypothetical protein